MKKQIEEILLNNIHPNGMFDEGEAGEQLTALMCYREVDAFFTAYKMGGGYPPGDDLIVLMFFEAYPKLAILQAIEQVKTEQK